ncbi:hypothetical protein [Streptomyces triticisoli]|uniref:hypothetical protein n=1 Tax=Streptomyces triticisoli TaxID=2182797 RepID=UPI000DD91536|nr:hypothetical protein [Streptomyces triticisoli]
MPILSKTGAGVVTLASVAALSAAVAPANASQSTATTEASNPIGVQCSSSWKNAVGIPGRWTTIKDTTCSVSGYAGYKVGYEWVAERGKPCIQVKGFANNRVKWYDAGCGKSGSIKVPWGNTVANKEIKVKGASLFKWR